MKFSETEKGKKIIGKLAEKDYNEPVKGCPDEFQFNFDKYVDDAIDLAFEAGQKDCIPRSIALLHTQSAQKDLLEWIENVMNKKLQEIPIGHEMASKGISTYNWFGACHDELKEQITAKKKELGVE